MVKKSTQSEKPAKAALPPGDQLPGEKSGAAPAPAPKAEKPAKAVLPEQVKLAGLYGFFDDEGSFHSWPEGHVVTDPAHIELLIARGAPLAE